MKCYADITSKFNCVDSCMHVLQMTLRGSCGIKSIKPQEYQIDTGLYRLKTAAFKSTRTLKVITSFSSSHLSFIIWHTGTAGDRKLSMLVAMLRAQV